jgi:hypothetical protein
MKFTIEQYDSMSWNVVINTRFLITDHLRVAIETTLGIDGGLFFNYRALITAGKMFTFEEIAENLTSTINKYLDCPLDVKSKIDLQEMLKNAIDRQDYETAKSIQDKLNEIP